MRLADTRPETRRSAAGLSAGLSSRFHLPGGIDATADAGYTMTLRLTNCL
jgi:hypothetical protein